MGGLSRLDRAGRRGGHEPVAERRIVTVLFADLVGFTSLSDALAAEDVAQAMRPVAYWP